MKKCSATGYKSPWAVSMNHNACTLTIMCGRKTSFLGSKSKMRYAAFDKAARRYPLERTMITRPDLSLNPDAPRRRNTTVLLVARSLVR